MTVAALACCSGVGTTAELVSADAESPVTAAWFAEDFGSLPCGLFAVGCCCCCCETSFHGMYFHVSMEQELKVMLAVAISVKLSRFMHAY